MTEYKWETKSGHAVTVQFTATAEIVTFEGNGWDTVSETALIERVASIVYLDGESLGPVEYQMLGSRATEQIYAALNGKIGLSKDRFEDLRATEAEAKAEARDTEEIRQYLAEQKKKKEAAAKAARSYEAHRNRMSQVMGY